MSESPVELVQRYEIDKRALHGLEPEIRQMVVDHLRHVGNPVGEIAFMCGVTYRTISRDFIAIRKERAQDELNYIPAREMAAELKADAAQAYAMAVRNNDPLVAFGIKLKLAELMAEWGLILIDKQGNEMPATLMGMRKQLERRMANRALPATTEPENEQPDNRTPNPVA